MSSNKDSRFIPLFIGITGTAKNKEILKKFYDDLRDLMPSTPFSVICDFKITEEEKKSFENTDFSTKGWDKINLLVVLEESVDTQKITDWKDRFTDPKNPFASHHAGFTLYLSENGPTAKPCNSSEQEPCDPKGLEAVLSYRNMYDALLFIEKYNSLVQEDKTKESCPKAQLSYCKMKRKPCSEAQSVFCKRFSVADEFSSKSQSFYGKELTWLFILSFGAGIMSQIYGGINHAYSAPMPHIGGYYFTWVELALPAYILFFLALLAYYLFIRLRQTDKNWVEFRVLAEALRVQKYWELGKIKNEEKKPAQVADYVLPTNIAQVEGISIALHNWDFPKDSEEDIDIVKSAWVDGQVGYYKKAIKMRKKWKNIVKYTAIVFYVLSFIFAISYFVFTFVEKSTQSAEGVYNFFNLFPWSLSDGFWLELGPFIFAMIGYLVEKKGWEEEIESFEQSKKMFETIQQQLAAKELEKKKELLFALGKEALKEHASWLQLHRNRKPSPNF